VFGAVEDLARLPELIDDLHAQLTSP
jgi:hypothetical protein